MPNPVPDDYQRVTPYLTVDGAAAAIDFYCSVLGATERMRMPMPGDRVGHAELAIGDSVVMLADESPDMGNRGPRSVGGTPVTLYVYVDDVDDVHRRAIESGATSIHEPEDRFYGDRTGAFEDPFGHRWSVATHVEDVAPDEMEKRMAEMMSGG
jgi:PhnB protein